MSKFVIGQRIKISGTETTGTVTQIDGVSPTYTNDERVEVRFDEGVMNQYWNVAELDDATEQSTNPETNFDSLAATGETQESGVNTVDVDESTGEQPNSAETS